MLFLVTGTPGAGKTLFTLDKVYNTYRKNVSEAESRPLFISGIPGLDWEFFGASELKNPEKWYDCPEGSIIIIDEAQRIFPQRSARDSVPKKCHEFETHRHRGQDIYLITQDGNLVDVHLRRLAGKHYHVKRTLGQEVATVYEYDHYQKDPSEYFSKRDAVSTAPWKYPKAIYDKYKSATMHTVKKRYPFKLFLFPAAIVILLLLIWFVVHKVQSSSMFGEAQQTVQEEPKSIGQALAPKNNKVVDLQTTRAGYARVHKPVLPGMLHTSPFYQEHYKARSYPVPPCIMYQSDKRQFTTNACKCFTEQMTTYETSIELCRYWTKNGFYDPAKEKVYRDGKGGGRAIAPPPATG